MFAVFQHLKAMPRVARSVRSNEYGLDPIVFHQILQGGIRFLTPAGFRQSCAPIGEQIAHSHNLDVRMVLETEHGSELADAISDDSHSDLAIRNRLPAH